MKPKPSKFQYVGAIVCGIPSSLPDAAQRLSDPSEAVNYNKAVQQHQEYVRALKDLGLQVIELPADEKYPDCVFVEDVAVVCDKVALLARLGHTTRRGEATKMKTTLQQLGLKVVEMQEPAALDGGDVLFTVTEHLHLKSMMTMAGDDMIVVGESEEAKNAWSEMEKKARFRYEKLSVSEDTAANCVFVNGTLLHLSAAEIPNSIETFNKITGPKIELENSELHKVDGCLTCLSILI
ncbi:N(G),N(G)-dimethylarginine dimethylaminohydrolase 1 [Stylophora pistillata]|uniref:N(G),N(G)-dimethylarginine dimethylaminohydrolase 1 n=1 Tax=Stylophora pistillata TaxID=50429 RepID=A0A2B4SA25_STYPI|nr:N(G),N(G)-dimethylarginine dimethylaminohydrolase 1 [Stylophora pistillata]